MAKRTVYPVPLYEEAQAIIDAEGDRTGMSKSKVIQRVLEWFAIQDEAVRASILGSLPASMMLDVAKLDPAKLKGKR